MKNERTKEDWGRVAVSLPGWRWMPGMRGVRDDGSGDRIMDCSESALPNHDIAPDPDDPATGGCLLALLGPQMRQVAPSKISTTVTWRAFVSTKAPCWTQSMTLGRACIAAAEALGRWPGGVG